MKTINDDPYEFYNGGGWDFLTGGGDDSDQESSEEGSVFEDETDFGSEESSESDESGSDFDEASDDSGSFGDESDEGEDWDELERKAERGEFDRDRHQNCANGQRTKRSGRLRRTLTMTGNRRRRAVGDEPGYMSMLYFRRAVFLSIMHEHNTPRMLRAVFGVHD